ncbi:fibronectin type III domain-containing protein [Micromonospora matsumotoense]|uniref:fibronectin type III domain-containing protein n=1 Tax=Micromonospora matsumotoense TaxID=121616 RepID=UPI003D90FA06
MMAVRCRPRALLAGALALLLTTGALVLTAGPALAVGTTLYNESFHNNTVAPSTLFLPAAPPSRTNSACLSAAGNSTVGPLLSCPTSTDPNGAGKLRLTSNTTAQLGGVFGAGTLPTSQGLDISFNTYQYGGNSPGADGLAFVLAAADPTAPMPPAVLGPSGGSLGYSAAFNGGTAGLTNGYLGIGFDTFGNFSSSTYQGSGCTNPPYIGARIPGQVVVRGPGRLGVGYCGINSTATTSTSPPLALRAATRAASVVPVQIVINSTPSPFTTASGITVPAGEYRVRFTPVGGAPSTLAGPLPAASPSLYPSPNWVNANGIPRQLAFGVVASTGSVTDFHEVDNVVAVSFLPVPDLSVAQTSYTGPSPQPGDPVNYTITAGVNPGANETSPISVSQTLPAGVVPVGAFGTGWVCGTPVGQAITCTNSNGPFANGTTLPPVSVVAIVTGTGVTPATIQNTTTATASSNDANPDFSPSTTPVAPPVAPSGITVTPATSPIAGGIAVTVGGTNLAGATAIEIGTTAEQQAATPVVLLPCPAGPAAGCFTVNGDGTLGISSMPSRPSAATVKVTVVTRGVAGSASYVYTSAPAAPAAPTATAGITSATVTWVTPADNGSPITGYVITPTRNGVTQPTQSFDASTTTRTLTGLTAGASYTFRVAAVNALGTGPNSPASTAVIPYTVPSAPTITTVSAASESAVLSWTAPANGGSAITGYMVTPYVAGVAQTPQAFPASPTTQTITGLTAGVTYTFRVAAINAAGTGPASAESAPVTVNAAPSLSFPPPPPGEIGAAYSYQLTVTGGTGPFTWAVSAGTLPPGLTLNPTTGLLSGTPTTAGSFPFTIRVTDASSLTATQAVTIAIATAPTLTFPPPPPGKAYDAYSYQLTVTGGTGPFTWAVSAGTLPPGLTLNPTTGLLSGTPTTAGSFPSTIRVTDAFAQTTSQPVTLVINPLLGLSITVPQSADLGTVGSDAAAISGRLGPVIVTDDRGPASGNWIATVSVTDYTTGSGSAGETIPNDNVGYSSGPAIATSGDGTFVPQTGAVLGEPRTAARWFGAAGANAVGWNPTLMVTFPPGLVVGTYTAVVTHSVL